MSKTYSAGIVTAYGAAKRAGYHGTYEDFCRQQAQYADNAEAVEQAKQTAVSNAQVAYNAAQTAGQANTQAQAASTAAQSASQLAGQSAQDAQTAESNASTHAQNAASAAGSAQASAAAAQAVKDSIPSDYTELSSDVDKLKADLGDLSDEVDIIYEDSYTSNSVSISNTATGWRLRDTGLCSSSTDYKLVKYAVTPGDKLKVVSDDMFQFQTLASVPSTGVPNRIGKTYGAGTYYLIVPDGATYLIVSTTISNSTATVSSISERIEDLVDDSKNLLWTLNKGDELTRWNLVYGYYGLVSGELVYNPVSNKRFMASKYPVSVNAGDVIHLIDTVSTRYFVHYSETSDNTGWETLSNTANCDVTIPNDGYVLISARNEPNSVAFTDDDINTFFDNRLVIVKNNFSTGVMERLSNADILNGVLANKSGYVQVYVTNSEQTLTVNVDTYIKVSCAQGDHLLIETELTPLMHPEFVTTALSIREQNSNGTTKTTNVTDLSSVISYVVDRADTVKVVFVISLTKVSAQSVTTGYYENVNYNLAVKKAESSNELDSVCTEAGDTWEV